MAPKERPSIDEDFTVETAHPSPPQSPRPLGQDGLPEHADLHDFREEKTPPRKRQDPPPASPG